MALTPHIYLKPGQAQDRLQGYLEAHTGPSQGWLMIMLRHF